MGPGSLTLGGSGNTLTLDSDAQVTASGADTTFVLTPQSGASSIAGLDGSDSLRFRGLPIDSWQALLDRSVQQGPDTLIRLDDAHGLTLAGVTPAGLERGKVTFG